MIDPIALGQTKEYTLKKDTVNPTIWMINSLDSVEQSELLMANSAEGEVEKAGIASMNFQAVKYGLHSVRNFGSHELVKETVRFMDKDREVVADESLLVIPITVIT